jgi:benzodiazapine receptor
VWAEGGFAKQALPLSLYAVQLALNLAWPALFFGAKRLRAALYDIVLLNVAIVATIAAFKPVNAVAANLLKPYLAWVLFATALNYKLWDLNKLSSEGDAALPPLQPDT